MAKDPKSFHVFIDQTEVSFEERAQTGHALKLKAGLPTDRPLFVEPSNQVEGESCGPLADDAEVDEVEDEEVLQLENGQRFWSRHRGITVTINRVDYRFDERVQTGRSLKERASIALGDVLFRQRPHEDEVIANDTTVKLKRRDCFHSAPPADYGSPDLDQASVGFASFEIVPQPEDWSFLIINDYPVPGAYSPAAVRLLVKLPPTFPDAAPDMFWVSPEVKTSAGAAPQGTTSEPLLGTSWQRFSWHLLPNAWRPGVSTLRDFLRTVRTRFEKGT